MLINLLLLLTLILLATYHLAERRRQRILTQSLTILGSRNQSVSLSELFAAIENNLNTELSSAEEKQLVHDLSEAEAVCVAPSTKGETYVAYQR